jgi:hypothetical protein
MVAINNSGTSDTFCTAVTKCAAWTSQRTSREQHRAVHSVMSLSVPYYRLKAGGCPNLFRLLHLDIITKFAAMFHVQRNCCLTNHYAPYSIILLRREIPAGVNKSQLYVLHLTFRGPCIVIYSYSKSQRDALFHKSILVKNSKCFGQIYCPSSSGVIIPYSQQLVFVMLVMLTGY